MSNWQEATKVLSEGKVAIIPTDTIYGIVGQAFREDTVKRIHKIKGRSVNKPFIILVSSFGQLAGLGISPDWTKQTKNYWPGPNSLIFPLIHNIKYLTCGLDSLAIRMPNNQKLLELITQTGPLVAPSANPEGKEPAKNINEAKNYFTKRVDFYLDCGDLNNPASALIDIQTKRRLR